MTLIETAKRSDAEIKLCAAFKADVEAKGFHVDDDRSKCAFGCTNCKRSISDCRATCKLPRASRRRAA